MMELIEIGSFTINTIGFLVGLSIGIRIGSNFVKKWRD